MYEPPLEILYHADDMLKQMYQQQEDYIYKCVLSVGVEVNKEDLLKALEYDRKQYEVGYIDGIREFANNLKAMAATSELHASRYIVLDLADIENIESELMKGRE